MRLRACLQSSAAAQTWRLGRAASSDGCGTRPAPASLEAAIITPLLLLLTFSIVDFGALFYVYLALENGVSQATRFGVTGNLMDDPTHPGTRCRATDSIKTAMRQATPTLTIPDSAFSVQLTWRRAAARWSGGHRRPGRDREGDRRPTPGRS